ncbi:MAG: pyrroline-5-carboxylate reductase [Gemmatimonadota bacterium]|jgi:pyrroline-5-carboxylate reductase|nr:pyrroline-5-carboxylate reductase [Gemmatimonadota bacterium]MDP6461350.1 pyrroline-5-carboxylate reductase [Gemmatimonadota bacterium]MDP6528753.1 pyrroline-5-carboxylate reductase [Gemmatimonadota bacterium]MDP6803190.1 pyrroline-5-carboxylate reductase [Gemmatimonadota bacterium]MDP7031272.1 pyrroline-5-carboxylate reductase [Gemmatimonadota bacterium]
MSNPSVIAILGAGNIGCAIARGLVASGSFPAADIRLTRRNADRLADFAAAGFPTLSDNLEAIRGANVVIAAVEPQQLDSLLEEIAPALDPARQVLVSVVSDASIARIREATRGGVPVVRAMPNTAVGIGESMTCLSANEDSEDALKMAQSLFDAVGTTLVIAESRMGSATALCACGIAFFLRAVRAASQGGIEIGFHADEALAMAAQTARGAASLLRDRAGHPESEIDRVTTPRGCTISGLNEMEHRGFSSAMIRGIVTSAEKAGSLYPERD